MLDTWVKQVGDACTNRTWFPRCVAEYELEEGDYATEPGLMLVALQYRLSNHPDFAVIPKDIRNYVNGLLFEHVPLKAFVAKTSVDPWSAHDNKLFNLAWTKLMSVRATKFYWNTWKRRRHPSCPVCGVPIYGVPETPNPAEQPCCECQARVARNSLKGMIKLARKEGSVVGWERLLVESWLDTPVIELEGLELWEMACKDPTLRLDMLNQWPNLQSMAASITAALSRADAKRAKLGVTLFEPASLPIRMHALLTGGRCFKCYEKLPNVPADPANDYWDGRVATCVCNKCEKNLQCVSCLRITDSKAGVCNECLAEFAMQEAAPMEPWRQIITSACFGSSRFPKLYSKPPATIVHKTCVMCGRPTLYSRRGCCGMCDQRLRRAEASGDQPRLKQFAEAGVKVKWPK